MWLMFKNMADDVPSEPCTNQTVVSLLDHFRPPTPNGLSRNSALQYPSLLGG